MILHFDKLELRTTIASVKRSKKGKKSINMLYSANPTAYQHDVKDKQQIISLIAPQEVAKVFGLTKIMWNQSSDEITIIVTGKLAQADYFNMITKDNVLKVLKNINQNRFIKFDVQKLYESAIVECCDVTVNMKVKDKIENYYKAMSEVKVLDGFDLMPKASRNMLRIKSDAESRDEVLLCYDKYLELGKTKNKKFIEKYKIHDQFQNILRIERQFAGKEYIRKAFFGQDKGTVLLKDLLVAPKHPVYDLFHKIFDGVDFFRKCIGLDAHIDDIIAAPIAKISYGNKLTYLGMIQIIQYFNGNTEDIRKYVKEQTGSNFTEKIKPYNDILMNIQDSHSLGLLAEIVNNLDIEDDKTLSKEQKTFKKKVYNSKQYSRNYANELDHPPVDNIFHKYEKTKKSGLSHDKSSIEKAGLSIQDEGASS